MIVASPSLEGPMVEGRTEPLTFTEVYEANVSFVWRNARRLGMPDSALEDVT
jgi:hypothetical protein